MSDLFGNDGIFQKAIDISRGKKRKKPAEKAPIVMPDEEELKLSKQRTAARRFGRSGGGRASTVLTNSGQSLGG